MQTVEINGEKHEINGYAADGLPIIKGQATSVHHKDKNGDLMFDEDGNPVRSVHISVSPSAPIEEKA